MSDESVGIDCDREKTRNGWLGVRIRHFTMSDYEDVVDLWLKAGLSLRVGDAPSEIAQKLARDPDLFLVAVSSGPFGLSPAVGGTPSALSVITGSVIGAWDGRRGWIYHLAVHPDYQRSGIGRALLHEVERRLAARGCRRTNLLVRADNPAAHAFYERLGYEASPELVPMSKDL